VSDPHDQIARRIALGVVLPVAIVIAALLPLVLFAGRLPEPLWNLRGPHPDLSSLLSVMLLAPVLCIIPALALCGLAFRRRAGHGELSVAMGTAAFAGSSTAAMIWIFTLVAPDAATWKRAGPVGIGVILPSLLVGALLGAIVARTSRRLEVAPGVNASDLPRAGLAPGTRAMWVGSARAPWALPTAIFFLPFALLSLITAHGIYPLHIFVAVMLLLFTSIRVTVDRSGVRIAYGLLGWPVQRVRLAQIRQASTLHVRRVPWGGWAYQGSLRLMRRAVIVLREGQGLRLELEGERTLDIAIDDAEQAAGVINDLIAANRGVVP
jgi:hypothetical protein